MTYAEGNYVYVEAYDGIKMADTGAYAEYTAYGYWSGSDRRLKEDITDFDLNMARRLRPVQFHFKGSDKIRYGFIAQEVAEVMPDAVSENKDGYFTLNYNELIAPILALVQEQDKRITSLENRLKALEEQINGN